MQVVEGADDRAARDGREDLDPAKHSQLRHPRQHPDVEERRPEPASGQREAELGPTLPGGIGDLAAHPLRETILLLAQRVKRAGRRLAAAVSG